jgi:pyruvate/2-oxoglutarate dehydrogenase complex dihydrolipoamide acyltransferase (E2) component
MGNAADTVVYRKTALGQGELAQRRLGLSPRARAVLVMVNGVDTAGQLIGRLGGDTAQVLAALAAQACIEAVPTQRPVPQTSATAASAASAPVGPPAARPQPPAMRDAAVALVRLLVPHSGPDAPRVAEAALRANHGADFNAALDAVAARLAIHLGRKRATELLAPLRQPA